LATFPMKNSPTAYTIGQMHSSIQRYTEADFLLASFSISVLKTIKITPPNCMTAIMISFSVSCWFAKHTAKNVVNSGVLFVKIVTNTTGSYLIPIIWAASSTVTMGMLRA